MIMGERVKVEDHSHQGLEPFKTKNKQTNKQKKTKENKRKQKETKENKNNGPVVCTTRRLKSLKREVMKIRQITV